jgi:hypothetical protein
MGLTNPLKGNRTRLPYQTITCPECVLLFGREIGGVPLRGPPRPGYGRGALRLVRNVWGPRAVVFVAPPNPGRLFAVRWAVVTNHVRELVWFGASILQR